MPIETNATLEKILSLPGARKALEAAVRLDALLDADPALKARFFPDRK